MTIRRATVHSLSIPLLVPYTIAYETITETVNHFLVLESSSGELGIGCAAPAPEVTGETAEMSEEALALLSTDLKDCSVEDALSLFAPRLLQRPSALAALDLAIADLSARSRRVSCGRDMGAADTPFKPVETSVTIGISSLAETLEAAGKLTDRGFRFLKIKGGHDVRLDIERLKALRAQFGPDLSLALDANQGYSLADVETLEREIGNIGLRYLEQPTPKHDLTLLAAAAVATSVPVMADEAVRTEDQVRRIGDLQSIRLINIKLQKMGGLKAASRIDRIAAEAGMNTMLGCMDESALSIAAGLHFGAAHPNVLFYDLDGHFDLSDDPFAGLVLLQHGHLAISNRPGLGWIEQPLWKGAQQPDGPEQ